MWKGKTSVACLSLMQLQTEAEISWNVVSVKSHQAERLLPGAGRDLDWGRQPRGTVGHSAEQQAWLL